MPIPIRIASQIGYNIAKSGRLGIGPMSGFFIPEFTLNNQLAYYALRQQAAQYAMAQSARGAMLSTSMDSIVSMGLLFIIGNVSAAVTQAYQRYIVAGGTLTAQQVDDLVNIQQSNQNYADSLTKVGTLIANRNGAVNINTDDTGKPVTVGGQYDYSIDTNPVPVDVTTPNFVTRVTKIDKPLPGVDFVFDPISNPVELPEVDPFPHWIDDLNPDVLEWPVYDPFTNPNLGDNPLDDYLPGISVSTNFAPDADINPQLHLKTAIDTVFSQIEENTLRSKKEAKPVSAQLYVSLLHFVNQTYGRITEIDDFAQAIMHGLKLRDGTSIADLPASERYEALKNVESIDFDKAVIALAQETVVDIIYGSLMTFERGLIRNADRLGVNPFKTITNFGNVSTWIGRINRLTDGAVSNYVSGIAEDVKKSINKR